MLALATPARSLLGDDLPMVRENAAVAHLLGHTSGMADSGFFRYDELPARTATGYLSPTRTDVLHLPVRGVGDGGLFTTAADLTAFWATLFAGRVVSATCAVQRLRGRWPIGRHLVATRTP